MGMDVYGVNPQTTTEQPTRPESENYDSDEWKAYFKAKQEWEQESGAYFRNNVWYWRPLWDYVYLLCGDILTEADHQSGHYNDGHLIDANKCEVIANRLAVQLLNGGVTEFKEGRQKYLDELPLKKCDTGSCNGTGQRDDEFVKGECNGCKGTGKQKDPETHYPFEEDNVREFHSFVKNCGGFRIN